MRFFSTITMSLIALLLVACDGNFKLSGTVSGLSEGEVVLTFTGLTQFGEHTESITITDNSGFTTTNEFIENTDFTVEISSQPDTLVCSLNSTTGTVLETTIVTLTCSSLEDVIDEETITLTGDIFNLEQTIQLVNLVNDETITLLAGEVTFTFETPVSTDGGYNIEIVEAIYEQDCQVENPLASLSNSEPVILRCELPFIALQPIPSALAIPGYFTESEILGIEDKILFESGYIEFAGRAMDYTNFSGDEITLSEITSYNDLVTGNFQLSENGLNLSAHESHPDLVPLNYNNANYNLVILIDTSTSFSGDDLTESKQAALDLIYDPVTELSRLQPNQLVSIVTFDFEVDATKIVPSNDINVLKAQIEAIEHTANSTSPNCAVYQSLALWRDVILLTERDVVARTHTAEVFYGSLVIISDGVDTAGIKTKKCANLAYEKDLETFYIDRSLKAPTGTDTSTDTDTDTDINVDPSEDAIEDDSEYTLEERYNRLKDYQNVYVIINGDQYVNSDFFDSITESRNIFNIDTIDSIINRVYLDIEELQNKEFGLFYYSYASPNRSLEKLYHHQLL
ncbi:MAG: hypothetical protein HRU38_20215 [Saccharospirillaceae bacterium]|nr:hypothetical protein [Pseudomonadales bacterium]NRB80958.1 hypothetical protein [Saccharospirillaceae bacterium]